MALPASEELVGSVLMVAVGASRRHVHMPGMVEFHRLVPVGEASEGDDRRHLSLEGRGRGASRPGLGREGRGNASPDEESDRQGNSFSHLFFPFPGMVRSALPHRVSSSPSFSFASFFSFPFSLFLSFFPPKYASMGLQPKKAVFPATPRTFSNPSATERRSSTPSA